MQITAWSLWWANAPFDDSPGEFKRRPVLVINAASAVYVFALKVTSHAARGTYDYELLDWGAAGLSAPSTVRVPKVYVFKPDQLTERIGNLTPVDIAAIRRLIGDYKDRTKT